MSRKLLSAQVHLNDAETLSLYNKLVDIIAARDYGQIVNEGVGEGYADVSIIVDYSKGEDFAISSIIEELGLKPHTEITTEDFEED